MPAITLFSYSRGSAEDLLQNAYVLQQIRLVKRFCQTFFTSWVQNCQIIICGFILQV